MRNIRHKVRRLVLPMVMGFASIIISFSAIVGVANAQVSSQSRMALFSDAAKEFGVPVEVLLAISYNQSRWQPHTTASLNGGFGLMNLTSKTAVAAGGKGSLEARGASPPASARFTLDEAATALKTTPESLKTSDKQNVRGAAALLAAYAKQGNGGTAPTELAGWYGAVAQFSASATKASAASFADGVYATMQRGVQLTTSDNQVLRIAAQKDVQPKRESVQTLALPDGPKTESSQESAECPASLNCRFIPAAYANNDPNNPRDYGNYDFANRPKDFKIKYIVIHDTEGSYDSAIDWFQTPWSYVSCNYVIRSSDGAVTQMVRNHDVQWCAGDWYVNTHSIHIEHEGFAAQGADWYTEEMYKSSATLVRYLAKKYNIPLDREHILGHDQMPALSPARLATQHWDPGPYWDWDHYMDLVRGDTSSVSTLSQLQGNRSKVVEIAPKFATNQPPVVDCSSGTCVTLPAQPSNFVYLRTQPKADAPLLSDPHLHPDGAPGTTRIEDWSAKATTGQEFVVADRKGDWTGIWYGGKVGWFYNPHGAMTKAASSKVVTPKPGMTSVPVYGGAYPEAAAFPDTIPPQILTPLYSMPAGQSYTTIGKVPTDYYYDATYNWSLPDDHMVVRGNDVYYHVNFNQRFVYVKASDVVLSNR